MKYLASTGCVLLHLTTFVFASPPPEDLTRVLQSDYIDNLLLGLDTSNQPLPFTLANEQSQQPSSDGPTQITLTYQPTQPTESTYQRLRKSNKPEDQKLFRKMKAQYAREYYQRRKTSNDPEVQKRFLQMKATKIQRRREILKRLKASNKPEDQKLLREINAYNAISVRKSSAKKRKEGLAGLSTQKRTKDNLVGTNHVHVPSHTRLFGVNMSNGPAQASQIQYDKERHADKRAERNADAVFTDADNLGRETELADERPLKRKKVISDCLELFPVTVDPSCIGLGTSNVHVPSQIKLFGISISNIEPAQESRMQYDRRETGLAVGDRPLKRKRVNLDTLTHVTDNPTCIGQPSSASPVYVFKHHATANRHNAKVQQFFDT